MFDLNVGDKLVCDNLHVYTLIDGDGFYSFGLMDESGEIVDYVNDYHLIDCLPIGEGADEEDDWQDGLCIGEDDCGKLKYTYIVNVIKN